MIQEFRVKVITNPDHQSPVTEAEVLVYLNKLALQRHVVVSVREVVGEAPTR